jgi:hypothetical protein
VTDESPLVAWLRQRDHGTGSDDPSSVAVPGTDAAVPSGERDEPARRGSQRRREAASASGPEGPVLLWDLDDQPRPARPPRRRLLVLAAVPWVVAVAVVVSLLAPGGGGDAAGNPEPSPTSAASAAPAATAAGTALAPSIAAPATGDHLAETAVLLVRGALNDADRYVDAAVVSAVEPLGDAALVTVLALVLERGRDGWESAHVERHAVALADGGRGPVTLAGPWPLPTADDAPLPAAPVDDPALGELAATALEAAGYRDLTSLDLARDPALPGLLLVRLDGLAPGAAAPGTWTALLTDGADPRLLGAEP